MGIWRLPNRRKPPAQLAPQLFIASSGVEVTLTVSDGVNQNVVDSILLTVVGIVSQHSFRWRNDDGDEDGATWIDAINSSISFPVNTNVRIRFLINADTDPDSTQYRLEYKPSTAVDWLAVAA